MPTATPFNNLITFSRGSNATVTGSNGLIQWAPNNLLLQSESFDNAAWSKTNATVTANTAVAPDGTQTADTLVENTATGEHAVNATTSISIPAGTSTFSTYLKAGGRDWVVLNFAISSGSLSTSDARAWFNISTGVVGTTARDAVASITPVGSGWYRCSITATFGATANRRPYVALADADGSYSYTGNGTSGVLIWGAQLELGPTATTYNPTTVKNLLGFSEAFDNALWTKTGASIVSGAQANPVNGLFNAQKLMENTTTGEHIAYNGGVNIGAGPVTASIYAKPAGRDWIVIRETLSDGASYVNTFFNIATGTVGTVGAGRTASIVNAGNGWYRCSITTTSNAAASRFVGFETSTNGSVFSYTGDGNSGVYIYGAQLSDSASLDPYVPTPGAAPSSTAFYGPRFDFDPVTLLPRGLLVEEQRTNLQTYSEDFANAAWTKSNTGTLLRNQVSPTGAANSATTLVADNAGGVGQVFVNQVFSTTSGTAYTMSTYFKQGTQRYAVVNIFNGFTNTSLWFDLQAGTFGVLAGSGATGSISSVGNGWYRCVVSATANATVGNAVFRLAIAENTTDVNYNTPRNGTSSILIFGAQVEAGAFATSYIPTVASTVTRSADVATITGQNFGQWYRQDEGSIAVEGSAYAFPAATSSNTIAALSDGGTTNASYVYSFGSAGYAATTTGGAVQANPTSGAALSVNTPYKMGYAFRVNDFAFSVNGAAVGTDTSGTIPTVNQLQVGRTGTSILLNGHIRNIRFIPARAADFQLQALTAQTVVDYFFLQTATGDQLVDGNGDDLYSLPIFG